ncbi:hypothetical protein [Thioalkalivibrio sp. ALE19]|uniref:hypothetical protein n=1 Tax=Thioalkalivibrio sp. ALE19 TaxID=1266909 RepID=UPI000490A86A|nr:hypothetical protein [Thioalkalivibrio sp. ALE19]
MTKKQLTLSDLEKVDNISELDFRDLPMEADLIDVYKPSGGNGSHLFVTWETPDRTGPAFSWIEDDGDMFVTGYFQDPVKDDIDGLVTLETIGVYHDEEDLDAWVERFGNLGKMNPKESRARLTDRLARILFNSKDYRASVGFTGCSEWEAQQRARKDARAILREEEADTRTESSLLFDIARKAVDRDLIRRIAEREVGDPMAVLCSCPKDGSWHVDEPELVHEEPWSVFRGGLSVWRPKSGIEEIIRDWGDRPWEAFADYLEQPHILDKDLDSVRVVMDDKFGGETSPWLKNNREAADWVFQRLPEDPLEMMRLYPDLERKMIRRRALSMAQKDLEIVNAVHDDELRVVHAGLFVKYDCGEYEGIDASFTSLHEVLGRNNAREVACNDLLGEVIYYFNEEVSTPKAA